MEACTEFPDPNNSVHTFITSLFMTLIAIPTKIMLEKLFTLSNDAGARWAGGSLAGSEERESACFFFLCLVDLFLFVIV